MSRSGKSRAAAAVGPSHGSGSDDRVCSGRSLGRGRWCDGWCEGPVDNIRADGINVHGHGPTGRQNGLAMGARKITLLVVGFDVGVQTLLVHSLLATGYGLSDRLVIGGVEFFGTTDDTRSVVVGEIFDGRSAMWATPGVLIQTASVLRGQPSINTGQMNGTTTAF